mgnify:CR=1 FL=1
MTSTTATVAPPRPRSDPSIAVPLVLIALWASRSIPESRDAEARHVRDGHRARWP